MIKKFNDYINEGLNELLIGPSKEEVAKKRPYYAALYAIEENDLELFKLAYKNKESDKSFFMEELLHKITENGNLNFLKFLINNGVNKHFDEDIAIYNAVVNNHINMVKYLINIGISVNTISGRYSILSETIKQNHLNLVKYLVEKGANIQAHNNQAMKIAQLNKHTEIVKYLEEQIKKEKE